MEEEQVMERSLPETFIGDLSADQPASPRLAFDLQKN